MKVICDGSDRMLRKCSISYLSRRPVASFSLCIALILVIQILIIFSWNWGDAENQSHQHHTLVINGPDDGAQLLPINKLVWSDGRILGLDPRLQSLYKSDAQGFFTCLDKSELIPFRMVNDDYCDCKDGSDEPSTSACPEAKFHCVKSNRVIPSSRSDLSFLMRINFLT